MSVSFIIDSTGKAKRLCDMNIKEVNSLCDLLSGSIKSLNKSEIKIIKNGSLPVKLSDLSVDTLAMIKSSVVSYKMGHISHVRAYYSQDEKSLILTLINCNMNVSETARKLNITRDKAREDIKKFRRKWGIDLLSCEGLNKAYAFALGS